MPDLELLFLQMAVVLIASRLVGLVSRRMGQPEVVGEMAAGVLLGPSFFGRVAPDLMSSLFPAAGLGGLYALSQVGLILFMFQVGLDVRPETLRQSAKSALVVSQASIIAPLLLGSLLAWALYPRLGGDAPKLPFVLFVGAAMSITAFPVLARILADTKMMHTRAGTVAISCAAFDDLAAWCLLAVITVMAHPQAAGTPLIEGFGTLFAYILVMVLLVRPALRRWLPADTAPDHRRFAAVMVLLLFSVWTTEALSVHAFFGAFLAGLVMPKGGKLEHALRERLESVTFVLLLPLYFVYTGLRMSVGLVSSVDLWLLCALIVAVAVASKLLVSSGILRATGMPWRESLAVGVLVNTKGLVELVILNVGLDLRIISPTLFSMMVIMAFATTLMTAPLLRRILPASA